MNGKVRDDEALPDPAAPGTDVHNRRTEPRKLTLQTGQIITNASEPPVVCAILNSSSSGVCLLVPRQADIPDEFELLIDADGTRWSCVVAWRDDCRIGVRHRPVQENPCP